MTPKEKAKELVERFLNKIDDGKFKKKISVQLAKQCALICGDEIIEMQTHPSDYDKRNKKVMGGRITDIGKYYQEVKKEIEKL